MSSSDSVVPTYRSNDDDDTYNDADEFVKNNDNKIRGRGINYSKYKTYENEEDAVSDALNYDNYKWSRGNSIQHKWGIKFILNLQL